MRLDRLLGIVLHLLDCGQASAGELARRFGVSERTIYRDMEALSVLMPLARASGDRASTHGPGFRVPRRSARAVSPPALRATLRAAAESIKRLNS